MVAQKSNIVEVWRIIPGHEPYMASNYGNIVNPFITRHNKNKDPFAIKPIATTKYPKEIVDKIRAEFTGNRGEQTALSQKYSVPIGTVHNIVRNKGRLK